MRLRIPGLVAVATLTLAGCKGGDDEKAPRNAAPTLTTTPPATATESVPYQYAAACTDADADALTLAAGPGDTCGGAVVDGGDGTATYGFTPGAGTGGTTCVLELTCADGTATTTQSVTIDLHAPGTVLWAGSAGGPSWDFPGGVAVDADGNALITGRFVDTATFGAAGSLSSAAATTSDLFLLKLDPAGTALWARRAGSAETEQGVDVATDAAGNVYVAGMFDSSVTIAGTTLTTSGVGDWDLLVAKYDPDGVELWAKRAGGPSLDEVRAIAVDGSGNVLVVGTFGSAAGDTATFATETPTTLTSAGMGDVFLAKLDTDGSFLWAKRFGGAGNDLGSDVAADADGNVVITGGFRDPIDFGGGALNSVQDAGANTFDLFVAKLDPSGTFLWAKSGGGAGADQGRSVGVDGAGAVYVAGWHTGDANVGGTALTGLGYEDVLTAKWSADSTFQWARSAGGAGSERPAGIAVLADGTHWVTGYFSGTATFGTEVLTSVPSGLSDAFLVKRDADGNVLWARRGGGDYADQGVGVAADAAGNAFVTGYLLGEGSFGACPVTFVGGADVYYAKYGP